MFERVKLIIVVVFMVLPIGCAQTPSTQERTQILKHWLDEGGWQAGIIQTDSFALLAGLPQRRRQHDQLVVYIEGDGYAWATKSRVSLDPTPLNPMALRLALQHPDNAVYLARPCQYSITQYPENCDSTLWTSARFSEAVIQAMDAAIEQLKSQYHAQSLTLVGYSGGAAVAALVAARRNDVSLLMTIAGNVDHQAWTKHHQVSPLNESLNPADYHAQLAHIPQLHFVGENDQIVPPILTQQFIAGFEATAPIRLIVIPKFDHHCCWAEQWPQLLKQL